MTRLKFSDAKITNLVTENEKLSYDLQESEVNLKELQAKANLHIQEIQTRLREEKILKEQLEDFKQIAKHADNGTCSEINHLKEKISYLESMQNIHKLESSLNQEQLKFHKQTDDVEVSVHQNHKNTNKINSGVLDEMKTKFEKMKNFNNELIDRLEDLQHENKNLKDMKNGFKDQMINLEMKLGEERKQKHEYEMVLIRGDRELLDYKRCNEDLQKNCLRLENQVINFLEKFNFLGGKTEERVGFYRPNC